MVRMNFNENTSTLLGTSPGPLELRVVSTHLAGQTVRLNAAKCTIGSGNRCTLRLQARRVEPVHCLILRGENATVIRRWSPQTRLNGATFTDALLQAGDRITIGPIELDVIATGRTSGAGERATQDASPGDASSPGSGSTAASVEYARLMKELGEREAALKASEASLAEQQAALAAQRSEWEKTQAEHRAELAARQEEHQALTHELNNLRQLKQDLPELLEERQQSDEQRGHLIAGEKELAEAQAKFEAERTRQEAGLNERKRELAEQATTLELAWEQLDKDRAELDKKQQAAEAAFHQREIELNQRQSDLEKSLVASETASLEQAKDLQQREQIWQESQAAWAAERAVWNTTCHETSLEIQQQQDEIEHQRSEIAAAREELAKQREALETARAAFDTQREAIQSEEPTELEAESHLPVAAADEMDSASSNQSTTASLFDAEQEDACDEEAFESASSEKSSEDLTGNEDQAGLNLHLHDDSAESMEDGEDQPEGAEESAREEDHQDRLQDRGELDEEEERPADAEAEEDSRAESEPPAFEEVPKASPAESSGFMDRLRAMADWEEDEETGTSQSSSAASNSGRPAFEPVVPLPSPKSATGAHSDDDEESIEDYMAKLMSRVRGEETHVHRPPVVQRRNPEPKPVHKPESEASDSQPESVSSTPQKPFEMAAPRQMPVELTSNLAALRGVSIITARDAIDTSMRNRWSQAAMGKFTVSGLAVVSAGLLLFWSNHLLSLPFMGAGVAVLVAFFWGLQGLIILRTVRKANQVLAEKANNSEAEAAEMRQMLYADEDVSEAVPVEEVQKSPVHTTADWDDDVVEIENHYDPNQASE